MGKKLSYDALEHKVKELRDSEEKYRNILENITDSYLEVDLEGNFKSLNKAFCKMLGCKKAEKALRESKEKLRTVMENMMDPVAAYDKPLIN